ncbi:MAG: transposase [Gammaproteobacteria bacterium]
MTQETYEETPESLTVRQIRIGTLGVVTTLLDWISFTREVIATLYQSRWHAELDLRSIKQVMAMDILRCQRPEIGVEGNAVHVLAYNLIRALLFKAACHHELAPRALSFKACLQWLLTHEILFGYTTPEAHACFVVLVTHRVADRPGRKEPRAGWR